MKKSFSNKLRKALSYAFSITLAASVCTAFPTNAAIKDNGTPYNIDPPDSAAAEVKPVLSVTKKVFTSPKEAAGQVVTVELNISGAEKKYSNTAFCVYWDTRLEVVPTKNGNYAKAGAAISKLPSDCRSNGSNGTFLTTMAIDDSGLDGTMWTIDLKVPDNAKEGDVFPIDVAYREDSDCRFTNSKSDKLMQSYFFMQGINSSSNPSKDSYLVKAKATFADGYIAIKNATVTTTTTAATTAKSQTSTTTAATTTKSQTSTTTAATTTKSQTSTTTAATTAKSQTTTTALSGLKTDVSEISIENGEQYTIKANQTNLTYKSNDTNVAIVSNNGVITAVGEGEAVITVYNSDFEAVQIKCTVKKKETIIYGDANADGLVDISDAVLIMQCIANPSKYGENGTDESHITAKGVKNGDVSGNGDGLTNKDALAIQKYMLRLITALPE